MYMDKTTIIISKDLRDVIKIGAAHRRMKVSAYIEFLVMQDLDLSNISR